MELLITLKDKSKFQDFTFMCLFMAIITTLPAESFLDDIHRDVVRTWRVNEFSAYFAKKKRSFEEMYTFYNKFISIKAKLVTAECLSLTFYNKLSSSEYSKIVQDIMNLLEECNDTMEVKKNEMSLYA